MTGIQLLHRIPVISFLSRVTDTIIVSFKLVPYEYLCNSGALFISEGVIGESKDVIY